MLQPSQPLSGDAGCGPSSWGTSSTWRVSGAQNLATEHDGAIFEICSLYQFMWTHEIIQGFSNESLYSSDVPRSLIVKTCYVKACCIYRVFCITDFLVGDVEGNATDWETWSRINGIMIIIIIIIKINQSINQSIDRSIDRSINQSINQSIITFLWPSQSDRIAFITEIGVLPLFIIQSPPPKKKNKLAQGDTPLSWNCRRWRGIHGWKLIGSNEVWFRCKSTAQSKPKL